MRNNFAEALYKEAKQNDKICVVVADISPAGSMQKFRTEFPNRFINCGVAEQSMIGIAAGLALTTGFFGGALAFFFVTVVEISPFFGAIVVFFFISTFLAGALICASSFWTLDGFFFAALF